MRRVKTAEVNYDQISEHDAQIYARFAARVGLFLSAIFIAFPLLWFIQIFQQIDVANFVHALTMLLAFIALKVTHDPVNRIMYTGTAIMFIFTLYFNATISNQTVGFGIVDDVRAAAIVFVFQIGVTAVAIFDALVSRPIIDPSKVAFKISAIERLSPILLVLLVAGLILDYLGLASPMVSESLRYFLPVPLAVRFLVRGARLGDPWLILLVLLSFGVAAHSNQRADILNVALMLAFLYVMFSSKIFSFYRLIAFWVAIRLVSVYSAASIAVRPLREDLGRMLSEFWTHVISIETVLTLINPLHVHSATFVYEQRQTGTNYFASAFYQGSTSSLLDRLTLLPQMDIVSGRLSAGIMDFSLFIQATLFSALPSFGQTKIVNLSDELAWQLSLRSRDTIGRPLVTAQAEAWSIGGYLAVFLLAVLAFGSWALVWRFMSRCIGAKSIIGAMAAMIIVYAIFSTTLTSQAMSLLRMPLQTTIGLWVAITVFAWFRTSKYKPAWTSI